jgi:hypothetical protein
LIKKIDDKLKILYNYTLNVLVETFQEAITDPVIYKIVDKLNQLIYFDNREDDAIISCYINARGGSSSVGSGKMVDKPDLMTINSVDIPCI